MQKRIGRGGLPLGFAPSSSWLKLRRCAALTLAALPVAILAVLDSGSAARAALSYWDTDGANPGATSGTTASGTWGIDNFWSTSSTGSAATTAWTSGNTA